MWATILVKFTDRKFNACCHRKILLPLPTIPIPLKNTMMNHSFLPCPLPPLSRSKVLGSRLFFLEGGFNNNFEVKC